jgi:hypothetical protein
MPVVGLLTAVIVVGLLRLPAEARSAPAAPAGPVATASVVAEGERPDGASAMEAARSTGERVEDLSQRTETTTVFANPDGTWTAESVSEPERVRDEAGVWHEVDTTLVDDGAGLAPAYAATDLRVSAGGDRVFAAITRAGKRLEWRWPTNLPEPVVEGDTATYVDALAGVGDLVVTATTSGFTHNLVVHERPAGPVEVTIPVVTGGADLVENPSGEIAVQTRAGDTLVAAPQPVMWDSSEEGVSNGLCKRSCG